MSARAPYNFVPFHTGDSAAAGGAPRAEKVLIRYRDMGELPRHDVIDPALKTGEIHVTMRAETPVFVSDGNGSFFRGVNGKLMLPGSSVRGMVRENMQILGFGLVRPGEDLEDYRIYFREMAAANDLRQYYQDAMGVRSGQGGGGFSSPEHVKSGYLRREGNRFYIRPTKSPYIRVPRSSAALKRAELVNGEAKTVPVVYSAGGGGGPLTYIRRIDPGGEREDEKDLERGVLLYTGKGIGKEGSPRSQNARYLFPAADGKAGRIWIPEEDRISYQEDYVNRRKTLRGDKSFWELPRDGEEKPVFYILHNGHVYFGMSLFPRIGYSHRLSEGLPGRRVERKEGSIPLDYPHAILGFAERDHSYRSRVSFGDFTALGEPREGAAVRVILGQPKPSWYAGYVEDGRHYNEEGFRLRGYKFYWFKEANLASAPAGSARVGSTLRPLPAGTEFRGVIRYKNLHPDELGLLLWALRLEDGCCQSVGMGRPYGLGRMRLTIDALTEYDVGSLYRPDGLCRVPAAEGRDSVAGYIREFDEYICGGLGVGETGGESPSIRGEPAIRDFFFMRSKILTEAQAGYMSLNEYRSMGRLPSVREIREGTGQTTG